MDILQDARKQVNKLCKSAKKQYFLDKIKENAGNQKELYRMTDQLLLKSKPRILPEHDDCKTPANDFSNFFKHKIDKITHSFSQNPTPDSNILPPDTTSVLTELSPDKQEDVRKVLMSGNNKSLS